MAQSTILTGAAAVHSRLGKCCMLVAAFAMLSLAVAAQESPSDGKAAAPSPPAERSSVFDRIGRWVDESLSSVNSSFKGARESIENIGAQAGGAAKDAAGAVARLPSSGIVIGRELCSPAPNGAPDCRAATEVMCRTKGFKSGRSLDIQSAQKCPARIWLSGRAPKPGECAEESFVTRAMCQ
jgi:hypothetical protein